MSLLTGKVRELVHGKAAGFSIGEHVYIRDFGRVRRVRVQGVRRDHLCIEGRWTPVEEIYLSAKSANQGNS